jgi:CO/xanthine dehydrogenase Mo-binding subunit
MKKAQSFKVVGKPKARVDGVEKVTGKAVYTVDIELPGMAYGKILRSPYAHAKVVRVDASRAENFPGVYGVITRDDQKRFAMFGAAYKDQTLVAVDKVRYVGDPVAAVAAVDEATAEEALGLIEVEFEELPAVTSIDEALAAGAPLVHESSAAGGDIMGQHYEVPKEFVGTNLCYRFSYANGDVNAGFKKADFIFDDTFTFPRVQHFSMEPHVTVAQVDGDRIMLWAATQEPFTLREHLADIFRVSQNKVRIIVPYVGAGYGGKLSVKTEPLAAALSWKTKRPVRLAHSIEESFKTVTRHPARVRIKTGVTKEGKLVARECLIYMETGAYADAGPRVTQKAGYRCFGPYRIPNIKTEAYTVYTNTVPAGAYRGFGTLQVTWAYESQMDMIAEKLKFDPVQFRLKNLLKKGELYTPGDTPVDCDLKEGLLLAAKSISWGQKNGKANRGKGVACCMKDGGGTYKIASAAVKMISDGSVVLLTGTVELGQGARTALSQVVAEEMGLSLEQITVAQLDTDVTPYDIATNASSSMVAMGLSVQRATRDLKRQILRFAGRLLDVKPERLTIRNGKVQGPKQQSIAYQELMMQIFGARAGEISGRGGYQDVKTKKAALGSPTTFWEVAWGAAEVEVDPDTGEIILLKYTSVADVGKAINPITCEGQDEGGVMNAIGHSLVEEMIYKDGQLLNPNLIDYRIPTFNNLPSEFETRLLENDNGPGPFGSKGTAEGALLPVSPALGNAVYRAIGVRFYDLPLTPERVWQALRRKRRYLSSVKSSPSGKGMLNIRSNSP